MRIWRVYILTDRGFFIQQMFKEVKESQNDNLKNSFFRTKLMVEEMYEIFLFFTARVLEYFGFPTSPGREKTITESNFWSHAMITQTYFFVEF